MYTFLYVAIVKENKQIKTDRKTYKQKKRKQTNKQAHTHTHKKTKKQTNNQPNQPDRQRDRKTGYRQTHVPGVAGICRIFCAVSAYTFAVSACNQNTTHLQYINIKKKTKKNYGLKVLKRDLLYGQCISVSCRKSGFCIIVITQSESFVRQKLYMQGKTTDFLL